MSKQIKIRLYPDGKVDAETNGIKGDGCLQYKEILEKMLNAKTIKSDLTEEYREEYTEVEQEDINLVHTYNKE